MGYWEWADENAVFVNTLLFGCTASDALLGLALEEPMRCKHFTCHSCQDPEVAGLVRERDSFKRQLAMLQDAILLALVQRIEPRMSRHSVTVVQHAGSIIARIGEAIDCQFEDGDDLVEAAKELVRERDEARASVADAYRRGAEAMREACIGSACAFVMEYPSYCDDHGDELDAILSALPIPEEP